MEPMLLRFKELVLVSRFVRIWILGLLGVGLALGFQRDPAAGLNSLSWVLVAGLLFFGLHWPLKKSQAVKAAAFVWCLQAWCGVLAGMLIGYVMLHLPAGYREAYLGLVQSPAIYKLGTLLSLPFFFGLSFDLGQVGYDWTRSKVGFWLSLAGGPLVWGMPGGESFWLLALPTAFLWSAGRALDPSARGAARWLPVVKVWAVFNAIAFAEPLLAGWGWPAWSGAALRLFAMALGLAPRPIRRPWRLACFAVALAAALALRFAGLSHAFYATWLVCLVLAAGWAGLAFSTPALRWIALAAAAWLPLQWAAARWGAVLLHPWVREAVWMPGFLALLAALPSQNLKEEAKHA